MKPHFFDQQAAISSTDAGADQHVLLLERQLNPAQNETFVHSVQQILTSGGVQNDSTLTINFNPSYQTLTWHWARIWRDGAHLERLDPASVKMVQPERDLDQFALNGEQSAILVLDDVRVGDVIDYSYTIQGANPVFGGHFAAAIPVQVSEPAERLLTRVLWPAPRHLYARNHGSTVVPTVVPAKGEVEYVWDVRQAAAVAMEDALPRWCDPQPWVQLSDFKSWAEVNQWAAGLFAVTAPCAPALARKIAEWKQLPGQEEQILAALKFVQDEVRYFGIEIGKSSQKPADPSVVFNRRYGDCKDKSLLFVTMLRGLGIEAYPVLVNTEYGRSIEEWQPSAGIFDHCIAVVRAEGGTYWLDPTMTYQRGALAAHYLPAYERGLVISPRTAGLTVIPPTTSQPLTTTTEYFRLAGRTESAELRVVTVAQDRDADNLRAYFATTKRAEIEKGYTRFYADQFPGIQMTAPVDVADDEAADRLQTTEYYAVEKAWVEKGRQFRCEFYPASFATWLRKPADTDRRLPLGISYPQHQILRTEVTLPPAVWPVEADHKAIDDPAFRFRKDFRCNGGKLVVEYEYEALADAVFPELLGQYLQELDQSSQALGYELVWKAEGGGKAE